MQLLQVADNDLTPEVASRTYRAVLYPTSRNLLAPITECWPECQGSLSTCAICQLKALVPAHPKAHRVCHMLAEGPYASAPASSLYLPRAS